MANYEIKISASEIQDAIQQALSSPVNVDGYMTLVELREETGIGVDRLRRAMQGLKNSGNLKCVRVSREAIDGTLRQVPAYGVVE